MCIITFMLLIIGLAIVLLGAAGYLVFKLVTKEKPPRDFSAVSKPPSFKDVDETYPPPISMRSTEGEKSGEIK